ncbi:MAG: hypothetical protein CMF74_10045 [Maricaulis sp.]|nr:hypothetical protein [Maricaulis sp.]
MPTIPTRGKRTEWEVLCEVLLHRRAGSFGEALLDGLKGRKADQTFVLAFTQRNAPVRRFDITRIKRLEEHVLDALIANLATRQILWKFRLALEEAL